MMNCSGHPSWITARSTRVRSAGKGETSVESAKKDLGLWFFDTMGDIVKLLMKGNRPISQLQPLKDAMQHVIDCKPFVIHEFNFKEMLARGDAESIRTAWQTLWYKIGINIEVPKPGYGFDISYRVGGAGTLAYLPPQTPENLAAMQRYISGENVEWPDVLLRSPSFVGSQAEDAGDWYFFGLTHTNKGLVEADIQTMLNALWPTIPIGFREFIVYLIMAKELDRHQIQKGDIVCFPGILGYKVSEKPLIIKRGADGKIIPITVDQIQNDDNITVLTRWSLATYANS